MRRIHTLAILAGATLTLSGCDLVGDLIEFGFWTIVILVGLVVLLGWGLARTLRGGSRDRTPPPG